MLTLALYLFILLLYFHHCNIKFDKDKRRKINKWNIVGTKQLVETIHKIINTTDRFGLLWYSRKTARPRTKRPRF